MASRRLAISSLLCEDGGTSESHDLSPNLASGPLGLPRPQEHPQLPRADPTSTPQPTSSRTQLASLINPISTSPTLELQRSAKHEVWEKRSSVSHRQGAGRSPDVPWPSPSTTSAGPSYTDRRSPLQRRTPSPDSYTHSLYPPANSSVPRYVPGADDRTALLRDTDGYAKTVKRTPQPQPHQGFHFPLPPHPSVAHPVDAREQDRGSHHLPSSIISPQSTRHRPSPTSPRSFMHPLRRPTDSPPQSSHALHRPAQAMVESDVRRSPVISHSPEVIFRAPLRGTSSLSPSVPKSPLPDGLSGLDVLVQAATEERERIDVHRRFSNPNSVASGPVVERKPPSQSPSAPPRTHLSVQLAPLTPPPSASSQGIETYTSLHDAQHDVWPHGHERSLKRRRNSAEKQDSHRSEYATTDTWNSRADSQSKTKHFFLHEQASDSARFDVDSRTSYPTAMQHQRRAKAEERSPEHYATSLPSPVLQGERAEQSVLYASSSDKHKPSRYSPPRSKPKSRKPGSAALATLERGIRDVELTKANEKSPADMGHSSNLREEITTHLLHPVPLKASPKTQLLHSSIVSEQTATADEEVDDFFQSTFDSPKPQARGISSSYKLDEVHNRSSGLFERAAEQPQQVLLSVPRGQGPPPADTRDISPRFDSGKEDADEDLLKEIADVAGTSASDDEKTEYDDEETNHMEVDIENELLSMVDDIGNQDARPREVIGQEGRELSRPTEPPENEETSAAELEAQAPVASKPKPKASKKTKKGKLEADDIAGESEASKSSKDPSDASKSKATKSVPIDKPKNVKSKGASIKRAPSVAVSYMSIPDDFPLVTSSGRLITKSKKSASGLSALADQEQHHVSTQAKKKKTTVVEAASVASKGTSSRSRSVSATPRDSMDPDLDAHHEPELDTEDRQQLYCVCKTQYDDNRVMIACDRCEDNWFHPSCVGIDDIDVELVDTFVCPDCMLKTPEMIGGTTYKPRCHAGLMHHNPKSPDACHQPARGLLSKYCTDECGVKHMHAKISKWQENGGEVTRLWENVKNARQVEGTVLQKSGRILPRFALAEIGSETFSTPVTSSAKAYSPSKAEQQQLAHLEVQLQQIVKEKEQRRLTQAFVSWQLELLDLASVRAERLEQCGWDQRLTFGFSEYDLYGRDTLESYTGTGSLAEQADDMDVDSGGGVDYWCSVQEQEDGRKCARHAGWQKLRSTDFEHVKEDVENALSALTLREREIRKKIEDTLRPEVMFQSPTLIFKASHKLTEGTVKKGKKKVPTAA